MVKPFSAIAVVCATVSIPRASPDTTVYPSATQSFASFAARRLPSSVGFRVPTMAMQGVLTRSHRPRKYSSSTGCAASRSRFGYSPAPCTRTPKCRIPASRMAPSASRAYFALSASDTKSEGTEPGCSRKVSASDLNHIPSRDHNASYAPSSRFGEMARSAKLDAAGFWKRSVIWAAFAASYLYKYTAPVAWNPCRDCSLECPTTHRTTRRRDETFVQAMWG